MTAFSLRNLIGLLGIGVLLAPMLAACGGTDGSLGPSVKRSAFTSKEFGVSASPRVSRAKNPPKGGGRHLVGKPYTVRGTVYTPKENPVGYVAQGHASWYGSDFHGRRTANGEIFSANAITGAHPTLPLPSYARVTNLDNGQSVIVRVNDRGPYLPGRIMDLSWRAADILGYVNKGTGNIQVTYVGPAPLNGDDTKMLVASINRPTRMEQQTTMLAMAEPQVPAAAPVPALARADSGRATFTDTSGQGSGTLGTYASDEVGDMISGAFGYAEEDREDQIINSAHAAAAAMATRADALQGWVETVDEDARALKLQLGIFEDPKEEDRIATEFAYLGAVDEDPVEIGGRAATRLTLSHLKPGATRDDVLRRVQELGLRDVVLY